MPTVYFGTTIYAAPILGILGGAIMLGLGLWWLNRRANLATAAGEGYGDHQNEGLQENDGEMPSFALSILPIILVFIINFALTNWVFKIPAVIEMAGGKINGTWPVIVALAVNIVVVLATMHKFIPKANKQIFDGAVGGLLPIFNTASEVGYGGVIKGLAAFATVKAGIVALSIPSLFKVAISTTLLAGIVGSSSGGTAIALEVLSQDFLNMGINPQALHRIMIMAAGGLDSLPHCGAVITLLSVTKLDHKQSYGDIAMMTVATPLIATFFVIIFHLLTGIV